MPVYQIRDWSTHFENDRSKQRDRCSFICVPNKQHGMGFCRLMAEPDGAAIYGIWVCILGACSQQKRPRDGWLTDDGRPPSTVSGRLVDGESAVIAWGVKELAMKFRRPEEEIRRCLDVVCSQSIGWMICHNGNHGLTMDSPSTHLEWKGREGKEGKGREDHFPECEIPSWEEFWAYCQMGHGPGAEFYAKDKFLAAEQDNWKGKHNWKSYVVRCRNWWEQDGRPMMPKGSDSGSDEIVLTDKKVLEELDRREKENTARLREAMLKQPPAGIV